MIAFIVNNGLLILFFTIDSLDLFLIILIIIIIVLQFGLYLNNFDNLRIQFHAKLRYANYTQATGTFVIH